MIKPLSAWDRLKARFRTRDNVYFEVWYGLHSNPKETRDEWAERLLTEIDDWDHEAETQ